MASEYPKTFYRYSETGEREGRTFACPEDVEKGWLTVEDFAKLPVPPRPADPASGVDAKALATELSKLKKAYDSAAKMHDEMIAAKDGVIQAQGDQIVALRAFIGSVREEPSCPEDIKATIGELLGDAAEEAAPKSKRAAKKAQA